VASDQIIAVLVGARRGLWHLLLIVWP